MIFNGAGKVLGSESDSDDEDAEEDDDEAARLLRLRFRRLGAAGFAAGMIWVVVVQIQVILSFSCRFGNRISSCSANIL